MSQDDSGSGRTVASGDQLGPYRIDGVIGAGGMGEVFRATDTRLGRTVAIKILPRSRMTDQESKRRFLQEARAASALNHPSIVTLHDVARDNGVDYLVMEFVAGQSLDKLIKPKGIPAGEAIGYAAQIAGALAAAHAAGIIHRDIKPANIIADNESRVKILDFGLAKLVESGDSAPTLTEAGIIMGTIAYMSPEQAGGKAIDHRSDIFSLGVVLYELVTGNRPFTRSSPAETMSAIINDPHPPLSVEPVKLAEIVDKALDKDPRERYQSAADLAVDLRRVQRAKPIQTSAPAQTNATLAAPPRQRKLWVWAASLIVIAAVGMIWLALKSPSPAVDPFANADFIPLTNFPGDESSAAISPDGKFVVFLSDKDGPTDIWLSQIGTADFRNMTKGTYSSGAGSNRDAGFSGDGAEIWIKGPPPPTQRMRRIPLFGGSWRPFLGEKAGNVTWSPDGSRIAYFNAVDGDPIFVANADGSNAKQIFVERPGVHNHFVSWSPDGNWIYFTHGNILTNEMDLWRISPDGGAPEQLTQYGRGISFLTPLDSRTVLYVGPDANGSGPWLWTFDLEQKTSRRIFFGLERYTSISASADGRRLVASIANPIASLWSVPISANIAGERDVKPYPVANVRALAPRLAGNKLLYLSSQGGGDGLWRLENGQAEEIWKGSQGPLFQPAAISPDGGRIVVAVRKDGRQTLRLGAADGSDMRPLGETIDVRGAADWSPDGKWVVTGGINSKGQGLFKIPVDGGEPVRLVADSALNPVWSPDGSIIAYQGADVGARSPLKIVGADGAPIDVPPIGLSGSGERLRFMPGGKSIVYTQGVLRDQDFWLLDLTTKKSHQLTRFSDTAAMRTFDITPDGKQIIFDRLRDNSDIVLIELSKAK